MTDRIDPGGGGLTGATGDLTPDESERAFVPGERREVEDPNARASVTYRQGASAPAQHGDVGDPAGEGVQGGPTEMAQRESGYGSEHGLAPNDPAYRMEVHPPAGAAEREGRDSEPRLGGDERSPNEERF
ncbi:MAG TPA: hypothetical protein VF365_03975 [Candidatus Limnocylindria bacterium]